MDREELVRRFANRNGAIFAGAGLSMSLGAGRFPNWNKLVADLRITLAIPPTEAVAPELVAGWFEAMTCREDLVAHIDRQLPKGCEPARCHELVAALPVDLYFTTNYDDLIERALRRHAQAEPITIVKDTDLVNYSGDGKVVIKLHGDLGNADYMVATRHDYDRYLDNRPAIVEMMRLTLMSRTVLFIGYSFNDHDLRMILSQVGTRMGKLRRPLYAIQLNPTPYVIAELRRYGVEVIALNVPDDGATAALETWLSGFLHDVEQRRAAMLQVRSPDTTSNLPDHCPRFLGRTQEIARISRHLRESRLVTLYGDAGVGKSALAIEVARRSAFDRKPQLNSTDLLFAYTVYVDARDCHDEATLHDKVLNETAMVLKVNAIRQIGPADTVEKAAQVGVLLSIFRVLIIIDHADGLGTDQASNFWQWASNIPQPSCLLIVTQSVKHKFSTVVPVGGFHPADAANFLDFHVHQRGASLSQEQRRAILTLSGGTPDGMLLLLGHLQAGHPLCAIDEGAVPVALAIETLLVTSWDLAGADARCVLIAASIFNGKTIARKALQAGANIADDGCFERAVSECEQLFLLSKRAVASINGAATTQYCLDPSTAAFGERQSMLMGQPGQQLYQRVARYYTEYARSCLVRPTPPVPYWNVLASEAMSKLDDAWPKLRSILEWSVTHDPELLVRLLFLLVHYMDTRLKNQDRLRYTEAAVAYLNQRGQVHAEALLRIDALGWTLIETRRFGEAKRHIRAGLRLLGAASREQRADLEPLAYTWMARAYAEQDRMRSARVLIRRASELADGAHPWIACRVHMVDGDIHFKQGDFATALRLYQHGQRLALGYGGEQEYQWLPRVGMAYLHSGQLTAAESAFLQLKRVSEEDHIAVGLLYAKYGLVQLSYRRDPALRQHIEDTVEQIRAQLARFTSSHVLFTQLDGVTAPIV